MRPASTLKAGRISPLIRIKHNRATMRGTVAGVTRLVRYSTYPLRLILNSLPYLNSKLSAHQQLWAFLISFSRGYCVILPQIS